MNDKLASNDWGGARGDKWSSQLTGMEATLQPLDEPLLQALRLDAPVRIAEVGSGGGGTSLEILRRAPRGSVVHGYDISASLVERARARTQPGDDALTFEVADMATAAPRAPYDRLASRLGIMFFDDPPAAFANLARWLVPGGRLAFAVWGPPSENSWITSVREAVEPIVETPKPDPDAPGPFRYADSAKLVALLDQAGLGGLGVQPWRGGLRIGGGLQAAEAARFAIAAFSSFGELLEEAGERAVEEAQRSLTAVFSTHERDGVVWMDARVHIVTGVRPK